MPSSLPSLFRIFFILALSQSAISFAWPTWQKSPEADSLVFKLDDQRLAHPKFSAEVWLERSTFAQLREKLDHDPRLRAAWASYEAKARELLRDGEWKERVSDGEGRYTYIIKLWLPRFALLYAATGQKDVGYLLRTLTLDIVRQPLAFWIHSELRPVDAASPVGGLETADLVRAVALVSVWVPDLFSADENAEIRGVLRKDGLDPCLRWLANPHENNWRATLAGGALIAALALDDKAAIATSTHGLEAWLNLVEADGSYGEQSLYFEYGLSQFLSAWWALGWKEARVRLQDRNLRGSLNWLVSNYVVHRTADETHPWKVNFGDDDFAVAPSALNCESLAYIYQEGLGTWMSQNWAEPETSLSLFTFLLRLGLPSDAIPQPKTPAELHLPTSRVFDNGEVVFRTGWTMDHDIVFALRGGGASRTDYSHDRGNRNAVVLFADGDYWMVAPGRASYRSPLRKSWDQQTSSHSAITFGQGTQTDTPSTHLSAISVEAGWATVTSDAAASYPESPNIVARRVWFNLEHGWIVLEDKVEARAPLPISAHVLLANYDGKSRFEAQDDQLQMHRPTGDLLLSFVSDHPLSVSAKDGYMHRGYSYYPGDANEGKLGSARLFTFDTKEKSAALNLRTLIVPRAQTFIVSKRRRR